MSHGTALRALATIPRATRAPLGRAGVLANRSPFPLRSATRYARPAHPRAMRGGSLLGLQAALTSSCSASPPAGLASRHHRPRTFQVLGPQPHPSPCSGAAWVLCPLGSHPLPLVVILSGGGYFVVNQQGQVFYCCSRQIRTVARGRGEGEGGYPWLCEVFVLIGEVPRHANVFFVFRIDKYTQSLPPRPGQHAPAELPPGLAQRPEQSLSPRILVFGQKRDKHY